ncbi:MAG: T9SS type A sorting domain-containing protein [Bacteroidota bacterium]
MNLNRRILSGLAVRVVILFTLIVGFWLSGWSQNYPIGHRTLNFIDPNRNDRPVPSEIYYPATLSGENTSFANGLFPVVVFGHGFQMGYDSYFYFKNAIVPAGYILVFPKTETSLAPNHAEYGADLAFLVVQMKTEGNDPLSPFYQHIDSASAIMGHSMGGGASFLACANNNVPTAMVAWAAAETLPSAIAAAKQITIPSLVFAADKDCITPPQINQIPMYDSLGSACKVFINIIGGGHCYFADANFICSLGEIGCPAFTISREQQHATTLDFTKLFLDYNLKGDAAAWIAFNDSLTASSRITWMKSCTTTSIGPGIEISPFKIWPNPVLNMATITGINQADQLLSITISNQYGQLFPVPAPTGISGNDFLILGMKYWPSGLYFAIIVTQSRSYTARFIKI